MWQRRKMRHNILIIETLIEPCRKCKFVSNNEHMYRKIYKTFILTVCGRWHVRRNWTRATSMNHVYSFLFYCACSLENARDNGLEWLTHFFFFCKMHASALCYGAENKGKTYLKKFFITITKFYGEFLRWFIYRLVCIFANPKAAISTLFNFFSSSPFPFPSSTTSRIFCKNLLLSLPFGLRLKKATYFEIKENKLDTNAEKEGE